MHRSFLSEYAAGAPQALALLPPGFGDPERRVARVRRAAQRTVAPALLAELRAQEASLPASPARRAHLDALAQPGTVAVVTGQQAGFLLGPLYTFYKAATAVVLARALEQEAGVRAVPVFWLQSEDHDFAEIARLRVRVPGGAVLELELSAGDTDERVAVAHRVLGGEVAATLDALAVALGGLPHGAEFLALVRAHYRPGASVVGAFAGLLGAVFADEGLVLLDPRTPALARLAQPVYRTAITACDAIASALAERGRELRAAGFEEQVHVRPGSPLLFFHERAPDGPRFRLEPSREAWLLAGSKPSRTVTRSELEGLLERDPMRFSTSALLRPLVQDTLLPTAAYLAGPAEIAYFAQLPPLYAQLGLEPPIVAPRARFRCLEPATSALLGKLGLQAADLERPESELLSALGAAAPDGLPSPGVLRERLLGPLVRELDGMAALAPALDPNLTDPVRRTRDTVEHAVGRLVDRYARALATRDQVGAERLRKLQAELCPNGVAQERCFGLPWFACLHGVGGFKRRVLAAIRPFDAAVQDLEL
ncbi:MAG TPA: bacillithiol biosynthesis cysteine-adding enzyme BshC [Polyangia bacterium]|nr:bacillithiol biosynthesis cysteine-adding enzyme BshC [Polyangia bacterium]